MKKLLTIIALATLFFSCKKENQPSQPTTGTVTFYLFSSSGTGTADWHLIIDGQDKGRLKYSAPMPVCGDPYYITLELSIGTHTEDLQSFDGLAWGHVHSFTVESGCHSRRAIY